MLKSLWIMRHGLAEDQFDSDFNRALSQVGQVQAREVAEQLLQEAPDLPSKMMASPFRRTQETAQIVHQQLQLSIPIETEKMMVHFADHKILGDFLMECGFEKLIIVSHMPIVARLCQYLSPACNIYDFQTAQVVKFNFDPGGLAKVAKIYLPES